MGVGKHRTIKGRKITIYYKVTYLYGDRHYRTSEVEKTTNTYFNNIFKHIANNTSEQKFRQPIYGSLC